jgi:N-acetylmuramoyl-L-alanine amidase
MIRIIKTVVLAFMLTVLTAQAEEAGFINQIQTQAGDKLGVFLEKLREPIISYKDIQCLARNIYYESANEPEEGKVAVGLVTLNRANNPKYPNSVCAVVTQKTVLSVPQEVTVTTVNTSFFGRTEHRHDTQTTWVQKVVCQFSWNCMKVKSPKEDDPRWQESQRIAHELAIGGYEKYREKYANAHHFHATYVNPGWKLKKVSRVGGHIFYE